MILSFRLGHEDGKDRQREAADSRDGEKCGIESGATGHISREKISDRATHTHSGEHHAFHQIEASAAASEVTDDLDRDYDQDSRGMPPKICTPIRRMRQIFPASATFYLAQKKFPSAIDIPRRTFHTL